MPHSFFKAGAATVAWAGEGLLPALGRQRWADKAALDERVLREGALGGDGGCWDALIIRHHHKVVVSLLARGVPLEAAKELTQETWTRLIESQRAGRLSDLRLPGLAIAQAAFLAASDWRRESRRAALGGRAGQEEQAPVDGPALVLPAEGGSAFEERLISRQHLRRISRELAACSPTQQRVFELVYQHPEVGYEQAAQELGLSCQRVKQIVCEVRKRLRAVLREEVP